MNSSPKQLVIRSIPDMLAVVPRVLGFRPANSVVMICSQLADPRGPHVRVDLGITVKQQHYVGDCLAEVVRCNTVDKVVLLFYSEDIELAEGNARRCLARLERTDTEVVAAIRVTATHYFAMRAVDPVLAARQPEGLTYDNSVHPFTADAIYEGEVIHDSREELASMLTKYDVADARKIRRAVGRIRAEWGPADAGKRSRARWLQGRLARFRDDLQPLDVKDAARVLVLVSDIATRDVAWLVASEGDKRTWVRLWTDLTQRSSQLRRTDRAAPAALLAFAAWQAGDGALAWCGVERCLAVQPHYSMAHLISDALTNAAPPHVWVSPSEKELPIFSDSRYADPPQASAS